MNKSDPDDIVTDFVAATNGALADWQTIDGALGAEGIRLRRRAAADAFLALAVSWESFLSRWLIAAVNRDSSRAVTTLSGRLQQHATNELRIPAPHVAATLITRSHLTVAEVRRLLDPRDFNVVIRGKDDLSDFADIWLAGAYHAVASGITEFQFRPALLTRLIRNALAHQSTAALGEANTVAASGATPLPLRWAGARRLDVDGWRRYLLTTTAPVPRITTLHDNLAALATQLTVP